MQNKTGSFIIPKKNFKVSLENVDISFSSIKHKTATSWRMHKPKRTNRTAEHLPVKHSTVKGKKQEEKQRNKTCQQNCRAADILLTTNPKGNHFSICFYSLVRHLEKRRMKKDSILDKALLFSFLLLIMAYLQELSSSTKYFLFYVLHLIKNASYKNMNK